MVIIIIGVVAIILAIFVLATALVILDDPEPNFDHPGVLFLLAVLIFTLGLCCIGSGVSKINKPTAVQTITITAEDGREIYSFTGKIHPSVYPSDHFLTFVDEAGNQQVVKWGATDTLIISENDEKSS